ncbi:MAG: hypothetical protein IJU71_12000, partial [Selenomonadaceae bacterium]|nr:hypothetical protein [Selenomonadaceae bacterium]
FHGKLANYGCKKIFCLTADVHKAVTAELQRLKDSGETTLWFMRYFMDKVNRMEHLLNMQHEICKVNTAAFEPYQNCFRGKKVVIVNGGATAKYYKPIPDAIHIAVEGMWRTRTDIPFDFVFTHNAGEGGVGLEAALDKIGTKAFVGKTVAIDGGSYTEYLGMLGDKIARYFVGDNTLEQLVYRDITCHALTDFWGAHSAAIQFAQFTFPDAIYLVGCDAVPNEDHIALKKTGYARLKMLGARSYPGTKIISINPIGLKGLFRDEYTEEYKASLEESKPEPAPAPQPVVESKPPVEVKPVEAKLVEVKPVEEKPVETKPVETKSPAEMNFKFPPSEASGDGILWTITEQVAK